MLTIHRQKVLDQLEGIQSELTENPTLEATEVFSFSHMWVIQMQTIAADDSVNVRAP